MSVDKLLHHLLEVSTLLQIVINALVPVVLVLLLLALGLVYYIPPIVVSAQ